MDLVFVGADDDGDGQVALVFIDGDDGDSQVALVFIDGDDGDGQGAWSSLVLVMVTARWPGLQ